MTMRRAHFYVVSDDPAVIDDARHAVESSHKSFIFSTLPSANDLPDGMDLHDWVLLDLDSIDPSNPSEEQVLHDLARRSQTLTTQSIAPGQTARSLPGGKARTIKKPALRRRLLLLLVDAAPETGTWTHVEDLDRRSPHLQSDEDEYSTVLAARIADFATQIAKLDRELVVRACLDKLPDLFSARSISLYQVDDGRRNLVLLGKTQADQGQPLIPLEEPRSEHSPLVGPARRNEFAELWDRVQAAFGTPASQLESGVCHSKTSILAPITSGSRLLGVLHLSEPTARGGFDRPHAAIALPVCRMIGSALNNIRVFEGLREQARTDGLTALSNRRTFTAQLNREMMRARRYRSPLALAMIDLDGLKDINDTHGHQAGDAVLQEAAERLRATIRDVDLPSRYGGDEFAVILPNTTLQQAQNVADRIATEMADRPCRWLQADITATFSIGLCEYKGHASAAEFIQAADEALYLAKSQGKNRVTVSAG